MNHRTEAASWRAGEAPRSGAAGAEPRDGRGGGERGPRRGCKESEVVAHAAAQEQRGEREGREEEERGLGRGGAGRSSARGLLASGGGCGSGGFKGVAGLAFIGAERGLGVRATPSRRGARSGARTRGGVPARPELGDDGRVPPRQREKKKGKAGADWAARWPARGKRAAGRKRKVGRFGLEKGRGKRKAFSFSETIQTLSI